LNDSTIPTESKINLHALAQNGVDPHGIKYAERLIWTTPDETYAKAVVIARFFIEISTNDSYRKQVMSNPEFRPKIAVYSRNGITNLYGAINKKLVQIPLEGELPKQVVIQKANPIQTRVQNLPENNWQEVLQYLDEKDQTDSMIKATASLGRETKRPFFTDGISWSSAKKLSLQALIHRAYEFYTSLGLDQDYVRESLAEGFFSKEITTRLLAESWISE